MTAKQPQAGEYWQKEDTRLCIVGTKKNGLTVGETECGSLITFLAIHGWQHLPDCDWFEWQSDPYPHYYESLAPSMAYARRDSETTATIVKKDGEELPDSWYSTTHQGRTRITESEALARLNPVEVFPQYWTTNDVQNNDDPSCVAFVIRSGPAAVRDWYTVQRNGRKTEIKGCKWEAEGRKQLTKEQAEALLDKPQTPVVCSMCGVNPVIPGTAGCKDCTEYALDAVRVPQESPDDWVEITDPNHIRRRCDWVAGKTTLSDEWSQCTTTVGFSQAAYPMSKIRCRRKDLPPVELPKLVPVRLIGRRSGDVRWQELDESFDSHDREIKHDGYKFYFEEQR